MGIALLVWGNIEWINNGVPVSDRRDNETHLFSSLSCTSELKMYGKSSFSAFLL